MVARGVDRGRPRARIFAARTGLVVAASLLGTGCGLGVGRLPLVSLGAEEPGFKMLAPDAEARACGAVVWPYGARAGGGLFETAVAELIAGNGEADAVRDLHFAWRGIDLLLGEIGCVSVSGDVGRYIPTITLPLVGEHGEHMHHGADTSHSE